MLWILSGFSNGVDIRVQLTSVFIFVEPACGKVSKRIYGQVEGCVFVGQRHTTLICHALSLQ